MQRSGPHDAEINDYLRRIGGFENLGQNEAILRHQHLRYFLARELESLEGKAFVVDGETGEVYANAVFGPRGIALVSVQADHQAASVTTVGELVFYCPECAEREFDEMSA